MVKKYRYHIALFLIALISFSACKSTKIEPVVINGQEYISLKSFDICDNGKEDVTSEIQAILNTHRNVYFPKGDYRIDKSFRGKHNSQSLIITNNTSARKILFDKEARLIVKDDSGFVRAKSVVFKIYTESGSIDEVTIDGLTIWVDPQEVSKHITGIFAIENNGYAIKNLKLQNCSLYNMTGAGILTYAQRNEFTNIHTENCGSHGIGALNPYNLGKKHYLFIDGHTSINDKGCSIDFSGATPSDNSRLAKSDDKWTGIATNIKSINSTRGIKTAGYWNLKMENVEIRDPEHYGFFINKNAPGMSIHLKNFEVIGAGDVAFSLSGDTKLVGDSIRIFNCGGGINATRTEFHFNNLTIEGEGNMKFGMRLNNNGSVNDFSISGIKDEYAPIWIKGEVVKLTNGRIFNNNAPYGILVHKSPRDVEISNIEFGAGINKRSEGQDILVLQEKGKLKVADHTNGDKIKITNKSRIKIIEQ